MKKIVNVLKTIGLFLPFLWISLYAKTNMMSFSDGETPYYLWNKHFCNIRQDKIYTTVILGDSIANASYMPEVLSDTTVNLSLGGTTPVENFYILKDYLSHNVPPKDVFISFMDYHFIADDCFWMRSVYTHRFSFLQNLEILKNAIEYNEKSIASEKFYLDFLSYEFYLPNKYITSIRNASFNQRLEKNMVSYKTNDIHVGRYISKGNVESVIEPIEYNDFGVSPLFDYYYNKLIMLCLEYDINVHLVKVPVPITSTFTDKYISQFEEYYNILQKKYPSITIDWFKEGYNQYCFSDEHHMNNHGALKFSMELRQHYRDLFDNVYSYERLEAINEDISCENRAGELLKWAHFEPYTLLVYDASGKFESLFEKEGNGLICKKILTEYGQNNVYILGASDFPLGFQDIYKTDNGFMIYPKRNAEPDDAFVWYPDEASGINFVVIDNYNGIVVTEKKLEYVE